MNNIRFWIGGAGLALLVLFAAGCRQDCDDPTNIECENYDPCYGVTPASAAFMMTSEHATTERGDALFFENDTFLSPCILVFEPEDSTGDKFFWEIEGEGQVRDRYYNVVHFQSDDQGNPYYGDFNMRLIVEKERNDCLVESKQIDTVVQTFTLVPTSQSKILGTYRGELFEITPTGMRKTSTAPHELSIVLIDWTTVNSSRTGREYIIEYLYPGFGRHHPYQENKESHWTPEIDIAYEHFSSKFQGFGYLDTRNTLPDNIHEGLPIALKSNELYTQIFSYSRGELDDATGTIKINFVHKIRAKSDARMGADYRTFNMVFIGERI